LRLSANEKLRDEIGVQESFSKLAIFQNLAKESDVVFHADDRVFVESS